jgi:hypothetical protein
MTLNRPLTILSITWSNSSSFVRALFNAQYVFSFLIPKLNKSGSPTMKLRYWSKNCAMLSEVLDSAVCRAKSSSKGRGIEERKFMYAGE